MKVKCPFHDSNMSKTCRICIRGEGFVNIDISTSDLIAELERRSKCSSKCEHYDDKYCNCIWYCRMDNFKEITK